MWAAGNKHTLRALRTPNEPGRTRGLTLLEMLLVVALIALGSFGVSLALRDDSAQRLTRESERLIALLEIARAQSQARATVMMFELNETGFVLRDPASRLTQTHPWLYDDTRASVLSPATSTPNGLRPSARNVLVLGPEPIIAAQGLRLQNQDQSLVLATDGLRSFAVPASSTTR